MSIRVLAPDVAAKIAAGEVVERPLSVVKELVENSLDAGAARITIEVASGGIDLIRVTDDGQGIPPDELELAFYRHATSKILGVSDLEEVETLGFRGEALPSIAAVARVTLSSRVRDEEVGQEISLRWGQVVGKASTGRPPGTSVTVVGLFENVPARRKFLRTPAAEAARVGDLVSRLALAFPEVQFGLRVDGRETLLSPGNGSLADAVVAVYGLDLGQGLLEARWEEDAEGYQASGYISTPSTHRANRSYMTFLVNRRLVQSRLLSYAVEQAYHGFLPERRFPVAVLNLRVPARELDVNVHPAKREVRFHRENRVFTAVQRAVRSALVSASPIPEIRLEREPAPTGVTRPFPFLPASPFREGASEETRQAEAPASAGMVLSYLRVLGQVQSTYVVAEGPDGVYLIDQHAAHERVLFEEICERDGRQSQRLLEPVPIELTPGQEEMVRAQGELLARYGFLLEPFGDRTCLVRAIPAITSSRDPATALQEVLDLTSLQGMMKNQDETLAASIACHSAVRAGMALSAKEMEELIHRLEAAANPHTCPHGRPTILHLSASRLEREFGRR